MYLRETLRETLHGRVLLFLLEPKGKVSFLNVINLGAGFNPATWRKGIRPIATSTPCAARHAVRLRVFFIFGRQSALTFCTANMSFWDDSGIWTETARGNQFREAFQLRDCPCFAVWWSFQHGYWKIQQMARLLGAHSLITPCFLLHSVMLVWWKCGLRLLLAFNCIYILYT